MLTLERVVENGKIAELIRSAFVLIRASTYPLHDPEEPDRREEINDLADLLHNMGPYIAGVDDHALGSFTKFRDEVVSHVRKFYPQTDPARHRYVELLDMDPALFLARHRDHQWSVPASQLS